MKSLRRLDPPGTLPAVLSQWRRRSFKSNAFYKNMVKLLIALISSCGFILSAGADVKPEDATNILQCKSSKSIFFKKKNTHDTVKISIITDQKELQSRDNDSKLPSLIKLKRGEKTKLISVLISQRGNSRRSYCSYKPLRISFLDPAIDKHIASLYSDVFNPYLKNFHSLYHAKLKELYATFKSGGESLSFKPTNLKKGPFAHLGNDIKIVSHCGKSTGFMPVGADTEAGQRQKLLQEFYMYKIQNLLYPSSLQTQLIEIDYVDYDEANVGTHLGFLREGFGRVAKRCRHKKEKEVRKSGSSDTNFSYQARFLMYLHNQDDFDFDRDGHNVGFIYRENGDRLPIPYDFDLSTIITQSNYDPSVTENLENFQNWILAEKHKNDLVRLKRSEVNIENLIDKKWEIGLLIHSSLMSDENKEKFQEWTQSYISGLGETLEAVKKRIFELALEESDASISKGMGVIRTMDTKHAAVAPTSGQLALGARLPKDSSHIQEQMEELQKIDLENNVLFLRNQILMQKPVETLEIVLDENSATPALEALDNASDGSVAQPRRQGPE